MYRHIIIKQIHSRPLQRMIDKSLQIPYKKHMDKQKPIPPLPYSLKDLLNKDKLSKEVERRRHLFQKTLEKEEEDDRLP